MRDLIPSNLEPGMTVILTAPLFLLFFLGIIWMVYRKDKKKEYERLSKLPLSDGKILAQEQESDEQER
jgi:cbb3-type cytochrome oxidase subunit 3